MVPQPLCLRPDCSLFERPQVDLVASTFFCFDINLDTVLLMLYLFRLFSLSLMVTFLQKTICTFCVFIRFNLILEYYPLHLSLSLSVFVLYIFVCYVNAIYFSLRTNMLHVFVQ